MSVLTELFTTDGINLNGLAKSKAEAFEDASQYFAKKLNIPADTVLGFLNARENLGTTGLGAGVAIPHGRIKGLKQPYAAFFRLSKPIEFNAPDGQPVCLLIFLLVPEKATQVHLEILSAIAQFLSDAQVREQLQTESSTEKVQQLICHWEA